MRETLAARATEKASAHFPPQFENRNGKMRCTAPEPDPCEDLKDGETFIR